jgi:hypothetical protein
LSLVYRYSVRPAESVSQIPALPLAVFRANVEPEAVEPEAVEPEAVEPGAVEPGAAGAVVVVVGPVVVVPPAADAPDVPQAAASVATAASGRPKPSVRSEVLRSMTNLPCRCGSIADPHAMSTLRDTHQVPKRFDHAPETKVSVGAWWPKLAGVPAIGQHHAVTSPGRRTVAGNGRRGPWMVLR